MEVESAARYNRADLLALSGAVRPGATSRLITDWIELGLLDSPSRAGLGRGRGSDPGHWSENQKELFLTVWRKRAEAGVRALCNIPVYLWVWWGEDHVPLKQARRAMATWASRQVISEAAAYTVADDLLSDVAATTPPPAARDLIAQAIRGRHPDMGQFGQQLRRVFKKSAVVVAGDGMAVDVGADAMVELLTARTTAIEQLEHFPNTTWEWSRYVVLIGTHAYGRDRSNLASDLEHGHRFEALDHELLVTNACRMLLTALGMAAIGKVGPSGTIDDPAFWREQALSGHVAGTRITEKGINLSFAVTRAGE